MKKAKVLEIKTSEIKTSVNRITEKVILLEKKNKDFFLKVNSLLYNPIYNGFHELRKINDDDTVVISDCCNYLIDATTTISNNKVKVDYLTKLKPVYKLHNFMEYCNTVKAWRVKKSLGHKSYLFYKDINVINIFEH